MLRDSLALDRRCSVPVCTALANSNAIQPSRTAASLQIFAACQKLSLSGLLLFRGTSQKYIGLSILFASNRVSLAYFFFFFNLLVLHSQLVTQTLKSNERKSKKVKDLEFYGRFLSLVFTVGSPTVMHPPSAQHYRVALTPELRTNTSGARF